MGKYEVGVLGNFDGKIGTVVGARWKGITYMRHKGRKSTKPPTASQLDKQAKFAMVAKFANKFRKLLMAGYPDTTEQTQINQAVSEIYRKAVTGSYPAYRLVYSKVSLSKGELHNATLPTAVAAGGGIIKFTWTDVRTTMARWLMIRRSLRYIARSWSKASLNWEEHTGARVPIS